MVVGKIHKFTEFLMFIFYMPVFLLVKSGKKLRYDDWSPEWIPAVTVGLAPRQIKNDSLSLLLSGFHFPGADLCLLVFAMYLKGWLEMAGNDHFSNQGKLKSLEEWHHQKPSFPPGINGSGALRIHLLKVKHWEKPGFFLVLVRSCIKNQRHPTTVFFLKILAPIFWSSKRVTFSEGLHDLGYDCNNIMQ